MCASGYSTMAFNLQQNLPCSTPPQNPQHNAPRTVGCVWCRLLVGHGRADCECDLGTPRLYAGKHFVLAFPGRGHRALGRVCAPLAVGPCAAPSGYGVAGWRGVLCCVRRALRRVHLGQRAFVAGFGAAQRRPARLRAKGAVAKIPPSCRNATNSVAACAYFARSTGLFHSKER